MIGSLTGDPAVMRRVFLVDLWNALMMTLAPSNMIPMAVGFTIALPCILSSRILLNLREMDRKRQCQMDIEGIPLDQWETLVRCCPDEEAGGRG